MSGWSIPPRSNAAGPGRPPDAPTWPDGPIRLLRLATPGTSGGCGCTWSPPCAASGGLRPGRRQSRRAADPAGHPRADPGLAAARPGQILIADKNYYGEDFEAALAAAGLTLLRPARKGEPERAGAQLFKPLRQTIESINQTFKAQLDLERHGGRTPTGVIVRVLQRILALTAAIWHNDQTGAPVHRSLTAYDH